MTRVFRYVAIGAVELALLAAAFGLGRAMTPPVIALQPLQTATSSAWLASPTCAVTGDLVGDANPADIVRTLCGSAGH
jgi:hypothetical protein